MVSVDHLYSPGRSLGRDQHASANDHWGWLQVARMIWFASSRDFVALGRLSASGGRWYQPGQNRSKITGLAAVMRSLAGPIRPSATTVLTALPWRPELSTPFLQTGSSLRHPGQEDIGVLRVHGADAALAIHDDVVRIYEQAYNAHTFEFEKDLGCFAAPDITIVSGDEFAGRDLLAALSDARADYVRNTGATVSISVETTCVADLNTTVVLVAKGELVFTYPDQTTYALPILISSTLRLLGYTWVFQHVHFAGTGF
jgi:hypothetical protein